MRIAWFCYKKKLFINSGLEYSHTLASPASLDGPEETATVNNPRGCTFAYVNTVKWFYNNKYLGKSSIQLLVCVS
jgi:hypothetical protein